MISAAAAYSVQQSFRHRPRPSSLHHTTTSYTLDPIYLFKLSSPILFLGDCPPHFAAEISGQPMSGMTYSLAPTTGKFFGNICRHLGKENLASILFHRPEFHEAPHVHCQSRQKRRSKCRRLKHRRTIDWYTKDVGLKLHQETVHSRTSIHIERRKVQTCIRLERINDVLGLICERFKRRSDNVCARRPAR